LDNCENSGNVAGTLTKIEEKLGMAINETLYFNQLGFIYAHDVRYDPHNPAFFNPLPHGRIQFRLHTEPDIVEVVLIANHGRVQALPLRPFGRGQRFTYWQGELDTSDATRDELVYSFALRRADGRVAYWGGRGMTHLIETPFRVALRSLAPFSTPDWMHGAVMYQIFPERFANGRPEITPEPQLTWDDDPTWSHFHGGDLHGITANLDYLVDLGIDVLYLNPINVSPSNHKYDAVDFYHVDPGFGGDEALRELVEAAHGRGLKIILDASLNHCYPQFFAFQDLIQNGVDSPYRDWFKVHDYPVRVKVRPHKLDELPAEQQARFRPYLQRFTQLSGVPVVEVHDDNGPLVEPTYEAWYGVLNMPHLQQTNPETRAYFLDVAAHWLREFNIDGWRMDVAQFVADVFWREFRPVCKAINPEVVLIAEIWGDTSHWLQGDMFDGTMNYLFRDLAVGYFATAELTTAEFVEGVTRLNALYAPQVTAVSQNLFGSHDVPRFLHVADEQAARLALATTFKLTMPGAPSIYYGDEIGLTGGADPDNRRTFPWEDRARWNHDLLAHTTKLIHLRRELPALRLGAWALVWHGREGLAYVRTYQGQRVLVVLARQEGLTQVALGITAKAVEIVHGRGELEIVPGSLIVKYLPPWSAQIATLTSPAP
jgi:cyclomaltodextrinase